MMPIPAMLPWIMRDGFPARITGGTGPYDWALQKIDTDATPWDDPDEVDGTANAYDLNGAAHVVGEIVFLKQAPGLDTDGAPIYLIVSSGGGANFIVVTLEQVGGADGDATHEPTYTYDATSTLDGITVWEGMVPAQNRWMAKGIRPATIGMIWFDRSQNPPAPTLIAFDEIFAGGACVIPPP